MIVCILCIPSLAKNLTHLYLFLSLSVNFNGIVKVIQNEEVSCHKIHSFSKKYCVSQINLQRKRLMNPKESSLQMLVWPYAPPSMANSSQLLSQTEEKREGLYIKLGQLFTTQPQVINSAYACFGLCKILQDIPILVNIVATKLDLLLESDHQKAKKSNLL